MTVVSDRREDVGQHVEELRPILRAVAEAVADSLASGMPPPQNPTLASALQYALIAESVDAGKAAEARYYAVRRAFSEEVRCAVKASPEASEHCAGAVCQEQSSKPRALRPIRVEVRGTAGRAMLADSFAVGSEPECDVEVFGDCSVLPLQFVVVSLPSCILVVDFWSGGRTRLTWRASADEPGAPVISHSSEQQAVFVVAHGARAILQISDSATVTLGPSMKKLTKSRKKKEALAATPPRQAHRNKVATEWEDENQTPNKGRRTCADAFGKDTIAQSANKASKKVRKLDQTGAESCGSTSCGSASAPLCSHSSSASPLAFRSSSPITC